ncbi:MAG: helix-turn-helix transcriptional regulator [Lachnospiraceae bacterium]|nr:helix-turn-helix transcriptional regulator [Lachnospiraceae bacterium]MBR4608480.1 helix-turn-helix transcriptional regulator [Lachnospiraceae bacterium]
MKFSGQKLKAAREAKQLTLRELALELQNKHNYAVLDASTLARWEANPNACPRRKTLLLVAEYLEVDIEELYVDEEPVLNVGMDSCEVIKMIERIIQIHANDNCDSRLKLLADLLK